MKAKKNLLMRGKLLRLFVLSCVILSIIIWVVFKKPIYKKPTLSQSTLINSSSWKEYQSEWATNVGITGGNPYITYYLVFSVTAKLPEGWAIGDNSYYYNNDRTTWKWIEGSHIRPGLVPSHYVKIERITITNDPNTDKDYQENPTYGKYLTRISKNGLVVLVLSASKSDLEVEIIKSLQITLKNSKCINRETNALNYDCPAPVNIPLGEY